MRTNNEQLNIKNPFFVEEDGFLVFNSLARPNKKVDLGFDIKSMVKLNTKLL